MSINILKNKIRMAEPVVNMFNQYKDVLKREYDVDQKTIGSVNNTIKLIPPLIKSISQWQYRTRADAVKLAQVSAKLDQYVSVVYDLVESGNLMMKSKASVSTTTANTKTMLDRLVASYSSYITNGIMILNAQLIRTLVADMKWPDIPTRADIDELGREFKDAPDARLLHHAVLKRWHDRMSRSEHGAVYHAVSAAMVEVKNSLFPALQMKTSPSRSEYVFQNMGLIPLRINVDMDDVTRVCFGKSPIHGGGDSGSDDLSSIRSIAKSHGVRVVIINHHVQDGVIYDISNLLGQKNAIRYKHTDDRCVGNDMLERYTTIHPISSGDGGSSRTHAKYNIEIYDLGVNPGAEWCRVLGSLINGKWIVYAQYGDIAIHRSYVDRMLRGPSPRIAAVQADECDQLAAIIGVPIPYDDHSEYSISVTPIVEQLSAEFASVIKSVRPTTPSGVRQLVTHERMISTLYSGIIDTIPELKTERSAHDRTELNLSLTAHMSNLVDNYKLAVGNAIGDIYITPIMFREMDLDTLYMRIGSKITGMLKVVVTEIVRGKSDIYINIKNKVKQLGYVVNIGDTRIRI